MGEKEKANKVLNELRETSKRRYVSPYLFAVAYAGSGDKELTLQWLEKAYDDRSAYMIWLKIEPMFGTDHVVGLFIMTVRTTGLDGLSIV